MKREKGRRFFSLLLTVCMMLSMTVFMPENAAAIYHNDNAPAASMDVLKKTEGTFIAAESGAMFRVVDGKLYCWGPNTSYYLGLRDSTGNPMSDKAAPILTPTLHDFPFNGNIIYMQISYYGIVALTDKGSVYVWGQTANGYYGLQTTTQGQYPLELGQPSLQPGEKIVHISGGGIGVAAKTNLGNWFVAGGAGYVNDFTSGATTVSTTTFQPISQTFLNYVEGGVKNITFVGHCYGALLESNNGTMYTFRGGEGSVFNGTECPIVPTLVSNYEQNAALMEANPVWSTVYSNYAFSSTVIDESGSVWLSADNYYCKNYDPDGKTWCLNVGYDYKRDATPYKVFDSAIYGAKCVKVFGTKALLLFLCEDNSLYAIGQNSNQLITTDVGNNYPVFTPTQIFTDLSLKNTITGVYVTDLGVTVVDQAGNTYYSGDNSKGSAGTGNTDPVENGKEISQEGLPAVQPYTANEMIFEVEDSKGYTYVYDEEQDKVKVTQGDMVTYQSNIEINAGSTYKLNVYFNDFGKLKEWAVPIRFDPQYVAIVNGNGEQYASDRIVTPGAIGASTGIIKQFNNTQWSGGSIITGAKSPMICNAEGWLSVSGYTTDDKAAIDGQVKMFSVSFIAKASYKDTRKPLIFDIASKDNIPNNSVNVGYDPSYPKGAAWKVGGKAGTDEQASFTFNYTDPISPRFITTVTDITAMSVSVSTDDGAELTQGDTTYVDPDETVTDQKEYHNAVEIAYSNSATVYTVAANVQPSNASFPQVNWTYEIVSQPKTITKEIMDDEGNPKTQFDLEDLITIQNITSGKVTFSVSADYPKDTPIVVAFTATNAVAQGDSKTWTSTVNVHIKSFDPPKDIVITEKASLTDATVIYTDVSPSDQVTTFHVDFPGEKSGFTGTAVVWTLYDPDGNAITGTGADEYAVLSDPTAATGIFGTTDGDHKYSPPSVTVKPQHTTFGDTYLTLEVASAVDPTVKDSIKIKIHRRIENLQFKQDTLYLAANTSRDLSSLLLITDESEYYEANLVWSRETYDDSTDPFLITNGTSVVTAKGTSSGTKYDSITVTDTISGVTTEKALKIYVITVDSPIGVDDIKVVNNIGTKSDYAEVSGLLAGDLVVFTKTFDTPTGDYETKQDATERYNALMGAPTSSGEGADKVILIKKFNVTAEMLSGGDTFNFTLADDFLANAGGDIGFILIRDKEGLNMPYSKVPVAYGPEPSKVYGYVRLLGKKDNSEQNAGIAVTLVGASTPETVYTDANGYFVFNEYIIPGSYTMTITKSNYLTRVIKADPATGYRGIPITPAKEFAISTSDSPIHLYPGDLDGNMAINASDIQNYVRNWYGQYDWTMGNFARFDFFDGGQQVIDLDDLDMLVRHNGYNVESYAAWNVPVVK